MPSAKMRNSVELSRVWTGLTQFISVLEDHCAETSIVPNKHDRLLSFGMLLPVTSITLPPDPANAFGVIEIRVAGARDVNVNLLLVKLPFIFTSAAKTAASLAGNSDTMSAELTK